MLHKPSQYKKENRIYNIYKNILPKFTETSLLHIQKNFIKKNEKIGLTQRTIVR